MSKISVGMSGGVDSSVVAGLLVEQGHDVSGVFMKNWDDLTSSPAYREGMKTDCTWEQDAEDARLVCEKLGIPFSIYHFEKEYYAAVFEGFLSDIRDGLTPNPDILCNQEIKFDVFLNRALSDSAEQIATGHYARLSDGRLLRPKDLNKDQTYFLARMPKQSLYKTLFPLSEYTKQEVRDLASKFGFANARKKDSTGICFIGNIDYRVFLKQFFAPAPGDIISVDGKVLGEHQGLFSYTIGQRDGLGIGGTGPYYVVEKRESTKELVVSNNPEDPRLYSTECVVNDVYWLDESARAERFDGMAQVRYRQAAQHAVIHQQDNTSRVVFTEPQRAVTPGQYIVWYCGDQLVGSGKIIQTISRS